MVPGDSDDYCPFIKAVEHLGDRWSLLILSNLGAVGPLGVNALAAGLPGCISRWVLLDRLRRLEDLGLISRGGRHGREICWLNGTAGSSARYDRDGAANWGQPDPPSTVPTAVAVLPHDIGFPVRRIAERTNRWCGGRDSTGADTSRRWRSPTSWWPTLRAAMRHYR